MFPFSSGADCYGLSLFGREGVSGFGCFDRAGRSRVFGWVILDEGASYAYTESITGGFYVESPTDVEHYQAAWSRLVAESLDFIRSLEVVRQHATEHRSSHDRAGNGDNVA